MLFPVHQCIRGSLMKSNNGIKSVQFVRTAPTEATNWATSRGGATATYSMGKTYRIDNITDDCIDLKQPALV